MGDVSAGNRAVAFDEVEHQIAVDLSDEIAVAPVQTGQARYLHVTFFTEVS